MAIRVMGSWPFKATVLFVQKEKGPGLSYDRLVLTACGRRSRAPVSRLPVRSQCRIRPRGERSTVLVAHLLPVSMHHMAGIITVLDQLVILSTRYNAKATEPTHRQRTPKMPLSAWCMQATVACLSTAY